MTNLSEKFFTGDSELTNSDQLLTDGSGKSVTETLTALGWEGQLISAVILETAVDGESVTGSEFVVRGCISKEAIIVQASKIWTNCGKEVMIIVKVPTGEEFKFSGGSLASNYVDEKDLTFSISKAGAVIEEENWEAAGVGNLSLRLVAHLDKSSNGQKGPLMKLTVMIFPLSSEQLEKLSTATRNATWPGIKCMEEKCPFYPIDQTGSWGAPFRPLLNVNNRAYNSNRTPGAAHLRYALAALMRSAVVPEALNSGTSVQKRCKAILADPEAAAGKEPDITWPESSRPEADEGRCSSIID